ncbi:MAG TPA: HEAT repeat domain-containing protein [Spirochaetota bacterium]|nr:HEAT repeat domain-containing protein [Spirochaetota bacterium]
MIFTATVGRFERMNDVAGLISCLDHKREAVRFNAFNALAGVTDPDDTIISRLKKMVNDRSIRVKTAATLKLAGMGDNSVSDKFIDIIVNGSKDEKVELLKVIAQKGNSEDETVLQVIMHGLRDKKEPVKIQAIAAAEAAGSMHLIPYIAECLNEKLHKIRLYAAHALFTIGGDKVVDYLIGLLADKNPDVVFAARRYLSQIDYQTAQQAVYDVRFTALVNGMNDREPVRKLTVQKIGEESIREGLSLLHLGCRDKYREVRIEALKSISVFRSPSSVEFIEKLLNDRSPKVRLEAVHTLESIGDEKALIALEWALDDKKDAVRKAAHNAIVRTKGLARY